MLKAPMQGLVESELLGRPELGAGWTEGINDARNTNDAATIEPDAGLDVGAVVGDFLLEIDLELG
jgi:hypothetical protein